MDSKKIALGAMMVLTTLVVVAAGFACYQHWSWLEAHHLAGLAAIQTFFAAVSVVFAAVTLRAEWSKLSVGGVAQGYLLAFALMTTALLAAGVALLVLGWLWTFGTAGLYFLFTSHPLVGFGIPLVIWAAAHGWSRLGAGRRAWLLERLRTWRRPRSRKSHSNRHDPSDAASD